jgi:hypothetical protein
MRQQRVWQVRSEVALSNSVKQLHCWSWSEQSKIALLIWRAVTIFWQCNSGPGWLLPQFLSETTFRQCNRGFHRILLPKWSFCERFSACLQSWFGESDTATAWVHSIIWKSRRWLPCDRRKRVSVRVDMNPYWNLRIFLHMTRKWLVHNNIFKIIIKIPIICYISASHPDYPDHKIVPHEHLILNVPHCCLKSFFFLSVAGESGVQQ